ncbi:unnamed protein product [Candidula unifasciata]|uniref:G-protein coupled receptors family 2 profile 2 domain-containing protein n=1 Tax=Candidula unifasciata TaxID=100452 RepID=A0A8S3ZDF0_9EUPU|nr:unnamed protein product [Candidula unifasciata]
MATRLRQLKRVFLIYVLVIFPVVWDSVAGTSHRGITSSEASAWYSKDNETSSSQSTTDIYIMDSGTSYIGVVETDSATNTPPSEMYSKDFPDSARNISEETSLSGDSQPDYSTTVLYTEYIFSLEALVPNKHTYFWDKRKFTSRQFEESYCPYRCQNGQVVELKERSGYCSSVICFQCTCKQSECQIYGICCPDISVPYLSSPNNTAPGARNTDKISHVSETNESGDNAKSSPDSVAVDNSSSTEANDKNKNVNSNTLKESESASFQDSKAFPKLECYADLNVLYIRSCLQHVQASNEVIQKCESNIPENETSFDSFTLVTDNSTNAVYYNKFCAECNGVKQLQLWDVKVTCETFMKVYTARSMDEFLRLALDTRSGCSIKQQSPSDQQLVMCDSYWFGSPIIDTCNVTGLWREADEDVVTGCVSPTFRNYKHAVMISVHVYANIFCVICNQRDYPSFEKCPDNGKMNPVPPVYSPYSILFNLRDKSPTTESTGRLNTCNSTQWASPDGLCVPAGCSPGKILVDGNCTTAVTQITSLGYRLRLWFFPVRDNETAIRQTTGVPSSKYALDVFYMKLSGLLLPLVKYAKLSYGVLLNTSTMEAFYETDNGTSEPSSPSSKPLTNLQDYHFRVPYLYWVTGEIVSSGDISRDKFEQTILDTLLNAELYVHFDDQVALPFKPVQMWHDFNITTYCMDIENNNTDIKCFDDEEVINFALRPRYFLGVYSSVVDLFINLTRILTCKFVSFSRSQYLIEADYKNCLPSVTIKFNFATKQISIANDSGFSKMSVDVNGELNICCDFLDEQIALMSGVREKAGLIKTVQYFLTFVCMGVSMLCLLLTIVTYVRFSVLRSVAGKNNLCLCLSLFLAQASLLASFFTNVESVLCIPLGMLTHFLWINMFVWNFLCCFYMYRVFGAKTRILQKTPRSQNISLIKNVAFSLLAPAIVVSLVVVGVYVTSGGSSLGYGGSVCYLNDRILVAAATVAPVILITIVNILFFLMTIYSIHGVARLQTIYTSKKDDQHNVYIYVKLSSVTGAFWITFIAAEISDLDGLRIVAIMLNGLQGLFIFISFVCNKRVLMLYLPPRSPQITNITRTSSNSETKVHQRDAHHELQHAQSVAFVSGETTSGNMFFADITAIQPDSFLGRKADETVLKK